MKQRKNHAFCVASRHRGRMPRVSLDYGAHNWIRTSDLFLTKEVLYRLSYMSIDSYLAFLLAFLLALLLALLPAGLLERVAGIEPASSAWKAEVIATIRHPRNSSFYPLFRHLIYTGSKIRIGTGGPNPSNKWWRGVDSNHRRLSQQIYSLPPLATREPLQQGAYSLHAPNSCQTHRETEIMHVTSHHPPGGGLRNTSLYFALRAGLRPSLRAALKRVQNRSRRFCRTTEG